MKISIYNIIFVSFLMMCISCETEQTDNISSITNYANLELLGDPIMAVEQNTTFNDPGILATVLESEIPYQTIGNVNTSIPGKYNLEYIAVNPEGFEAQTSRIVFVYENNGTIAGFWNGSTVQSSGNPVLISTTSDPNVFNISDVLVGNYEYGRGLGAGYEAPSTITISESSVTSPGGENVFGLWNIEDGLISDDERTLTWDSPLSGSSFTLRGITLVKVTN